jgi:hypothetical protein
VGDRPHHGSTKLTEGRPGSQPGTDPRRPETWQPRTGITPDGSTQASRAPPDRLQDRQTADGSAGASLKQDRDPAPTDSRAKRQIGRRPEATLSEPPNPLADLAGAGPKVSAKAAPWLSDEPSRDEQEIFREL